MIWNLSKFYNTEERLTGLLRKISNEVIFPLVIHVSRVVIAVIVAVTVTVTVAVAVTVKALAVSAAAAAVSTTTVVVGDCRAAERARAAARES